MDRTMPIMGGDEATQIIKGKKARRQSESSAHIPPTVLEERRPSVPVNMQGYDVAIVAYSSDISDLSSRETQTTIGYNDAWHKPLPPSQLLDKIDQFVQEFHWQKKP